LLPAKSRRASVDAAAGVVEEVARIVGQISRHWPNVRIMVRADSGLAGRTSTRRRPARYLSARLRAPASPAMIGSCRNSP
jgi:hypothetical protein